MIGDDVAIRRRSDAICVEADDEMIVLDPGRGDFLRLNSTAGRIWALLGGSVTIAEICRSLATTFDVEPAACHDEVAGFVATLIDRGLIEAG